MQSLSCKNFACMGIKKHFHINSIVLSLPLKQILGATLKGHVYILGRGGGGRVLPYKSDGVLVVPVRGLNLWIGFKKSLRRKC